MIENLEDKKIRLHISMVQSTEAAENTDWISAEK